MNIKFPINKQNLVEFSLLFILIVCLNPEFADVSILYYGSIFCCFASLLSMIIPRFSLTKCIIWRAGVVVWAILSYIFVAARNGSGYAFMMDIILQSLPIITSAIYLKKQRGTKYKTLIKIFVVATCATCAYACVRSGFSNFMVRTLGYFTLGTQRWNSNFLGRIAAYGITMLLISEKIDNTPLFRSVILKAVSIVTFLITMIWCGSRTAILLFLFGVFGYFVLSAQNPLKTIRNILITCLLVYILYQAIMHVPSLYNIIGMRMERLRLFITTGTAGELSIGWRQQMIEYGLDLFLQHPIFGVGIDTFRVFYGLEGTATFHATYAHNNFVELLADGGIIGFLVYYSAYIIGFTGFRRSKLSYKKYLLYQLCILLLADFSTISYQSLADQYLLFLILMASDRDSIGDNE